MTGSGGYIELDRAVDAIRVGRRHRQDMGDIAGLAASIQQRGMLQPITVTPDGILLCGARRLAAVRRLGWRTVNVWVRSGVSGTLERLLAEQDENTVRKPLTHTEAATLYRELKSIMSEDAARRSRATRFGAQNDGADQRSTGPANVAGPSGDARALAARAITGRNSYTTLERVGEVQRLAADARQPAQVRARAAAGLDAMDTHGNVVHHFATVKTAAATAELERLATDPEQSADVRNQARAEARRLRGGSPDASSSDLIKLARDALARVKTAAQPKAAPKPRPAATVTIDTDLPAAQAQPVLEQAPQAHQTPQADHTPQAHRTPPRPRRRYGVRAFRLLLADLRDWTDHYDPAEIGRSLTDDQWAGFERVIANSVAFADQARTHRLGTDRTPSE